VSAPLADARAIFDRRVAAWLAADTDAYLACWRDDMRITLPGARVIEGVTDYRALVEQSFAWAAPVAFDVHALAVDGDRILADWTITMRRRADDVLVRWHGLSICEIRDGRIAWWREHHLEPPAPVDTIGAGGK